MNTRKGRILCSPRDPIAESKQWINRYQVPMEDADTLWVLGLGAGYHIQELRKNFPKKSIHVWEFDRELVLVSAWIHKDSDLKVSLLENPKEILQDLALKQLVEQKVAILPFRPAWQGLEQEFMELFLLCNARKNEGFQAQLRVQGLSHLADQLGALSPDQFLTIKNLDRSLEFSKDASFESGLWKCLRELVK